MKNDFLKYLISRIRSNNSKGLLLSVLIHSLIAVTVYKITIHQAHKDMGTQITVLDEPFDDTSGVIKIEDPEVFHEPLVVISRPLSNLLVQKPRDPFQRPIQKPKAKNIAKKSVKSKSQAPKRKFSVSSDLTRRSNLNTNCELLRRPLPKVDKNIKGEVQVRFIVESSGKVGKIRAKSSPRNLKLSRAVRAAITKWQFKPGRKCRVSQKFVFR